MKEPPDQEKTAPPDATRGTAMEVSERGEDSISEAMRNPEIRSGETTAAAMVPHVLADFYQAAGIPAAARQLLPVEMLVSDEQRRTEPERGLS
jgi:hypothetical protein